MSKALQLEGQWLSQQSLLAELKLNLQNYNGHLKIDTPQQSLLMLSMSEDTEEHLQQLLEEVAGLIALIESTPHLPFAHIASRQAALATQILEAALVSLIKCVDIEPLNILRAIATTTNPVSFQTAVASGNTGLVSLLMLENVAFDFDESFTIACRSGECLDVMRLLVKRPFNWTNAFMIAMNFERADVIRLLLEQDNHKEHEHIMQEKLRRACWEGYYKTIRVLIDVPQDPFVVQDAFRIACEHGHTDIVRMLLDVPIEREIYNSSFRVAASMGYTGIIRLLLDLPLERGVDPSSNYNYALRVACERGHADIIRLLIDLPLERGVNFAVNVIGLWMKNCYWKHEIIEFLLALPRERGVDLSADDNYVFKRACEVNATNLVRLLLDLPLERGVNPAANNNAALMCAVRNDNTAIVRWLLDLPLERGIDPAVNDNYALRRARDIGNAEMIRLFLDLPLERGVDHSIAKLNI